MDINEEQAHDNQNKIILNYQISPQNIINEEKPKIKKELIGRYLMEKMGWRGGGISE